MTAEDKHRLRAARLHLADHGIRFAPGLTLEELDAAEDHYRLRFPPDLRWFLGQAMPVGPRFPDWRGDPEPIRERLSWPIEGICFDIRNRVFWWPGWGPRPADDEEAAALAMSRMGLLPPLVPIFAHVYLPSEPHAAGNPVFSVHQADVIHRGRTLADYLFWIMHDEQDEGIESRYPVFDPSYVAIPFWTEITRMNAEG